MRPRLGDRSGGELPEEWAGGRDRRDRIRAALAELDRQKTRDYQCRTDPTIVRRAMDDKLARPTNTDLYRKRQHSIEPVFGNIKANLGYRRFARRGLPAVNSEWRLICASHNMLKLRQARPA